MKAKQKTRLKWKLVNKISSEVYILLDKESLSKSEVKLINHHALNIVQIMFDEIKETIK